MTCTWCGKEFRDGDTPVEILGESVCRECVRTGEAIEATWRDERELAVEARSGV